MDSNNGTDDFIRRLQNLTGKTDLGVDLESLKLSERDTSTEDLASTAATMGSDETWANDEEWDSDYSADICFGLHSLTVEELEANGLQGRTTKLNKARQMASEEPDVIYTSEAIAKMERVSWPDTGLKQMDVSPEGDIFCPWHLVRAYPGAFVGKANGERCAPYFTLEALHNNRVWDFYYIHNPKNSKLSPVLFVPTFQFKHLLDVINNKLSTLLSIPHGFVAEKFELQFGVGGTPRPRFLGRSASVQDFERLTKTFPPIHPDDNPKKLGPGPQAMFESIMAAASKKVGSKANKSQKNMKKRMTNRKAWGQSVKRIQRYLGLRETITGTSGQPSATVPALDLTVPMAAKPDKGVLFVGIDVEAWEHNQTIITEIGLAILDANKLVGVAPGPMGKNWFPLIEARHIRVRENAWAVNKTHIRGCPEDFEFGQSEFVPYKEVPRLLKSIIDEATVTGADGVKRAQEVVLVFHESPSDIKYLETVGYDVYKNPNLLEIVDTKHMKQSALRSDQATKLEYILSQLGLPYGNLHNAGNDAVFTLRAMVGLAVERRLQGLENLKSKKEEEQSHVPFAEWQAGEGWTSGGEETDGGMPEPPLPEADPNAWARGYQ
ncbi:hypothetical protein QBC39DRAFT_27157 [Podospora conica]|nr:hypothetical protein QBC39DRAFT_27157 [Schizothecium conicum]